ncbi:MAG: chemotaxis protein [Spirochaetes bacterium GWF1_31_7]|nr:MAG: chemotaxis protein [Spirochaetes bacterium GWE1_32_154]OHD46972.1 MAG: chemotaxis protein [Spirochaetes bacterium GWF1_31_7]OHD49752.1 MAG: chemotaxis protein [Spirochaetes bacterium GWE2_31_10]HBD95519.1 chemotaxis protein [Spirochaetia bacterium]HBI36969.1 chemotaxis protein [Spirochaetia bacterium]
MNFKDLSLKIKIILISVIGLLLLGIIIALVYVNDIEKQAVDGIIEKSRAIVLTAEATRNEMAKKIDMGVIKKFSQLIEEGNTEGLVEAVPVLTAINSVRVNAKEANYEFRVPKISPRNSENEPTELEKEVLLQLERGDIKEKVIQEKNQIRFFRPIVLTKECLLCHGSPAGDPDPVGGIKEGWKVGEVHGAFQIISSLSKAKEIQKNGVIKIVLIVVGIILIIGLIMTLTVSFVLKPLAQYIENFNKASSGDLTVRSNENSKDEIGVLSNYFNSFIKSLSEMISKVKIESAKTSEISSDLSATTEETLSSLEEMRVNTENLKSKIDHLDSEVNSSFRSTADVKKFVTNLVDLISSQSAAITESSASIEEMTASIQAIAKVTEEKKILASELEKTAAMGESEMEETVQVINKVSESANSILDMINVIDEIASKTDLLAMNAAIEAAHAGEFGKGFAVVADEIRMLAESSSESAKHIAHSLNQISEYIKTSEDSTSRTGAMFNKIVSGIKEVTGSMHEMNQSTHELSTGSTQILEALTSLIQITQDVQTASSDIDDKIENITSSLNSLNMISADTKNGMSEMNIGINEIYSAAGIISNAGVQNAETVKNLDDLIKKFKV